MINKGHNRYCGRDFSSTEIKWVKKLIEDNPQINRQEISRRFCDAFDWRKPDGGLKDMSCRVAFIRMHENGLIRLPAPKKVFNKPGRSLKKTSRTAPQASITKPAGHLDLTLQRVDRKMSGLWNEYIHRYHYLGYKALPGAQIRYFVKSNDRILALLGFGAAAWQTAPRDLFIGWDTKARKRNLHLVVNNARFLILPWIRSKNLGSRILSLSARHLADDFQDRYKYRPVLMETFVEKRRFSGTCYKAANWICVGETTGRTKIDLPKRGSAPIKTIWLYPLTKDFRERLQN
jgi:hypothetical protein